jgi:hypothetical protein
MMSGFFVSKNGENGVSLFKWAGLETAYMFFWASEEFDWVFGGGKARAGQVLSLRSIYGHVVLEKPAAATFAFSGAPASMAAVDGQVLSVLCVVVGGGST